MTEKKPSDVFLELWQWRSGSGSCKKEQFTECAEAWRQIVSLETREAERKAASEAFFKNILTSPIMPAPTEPGPVTCAAAEGPGDPSPAAQDDRPEPVTYDCASAPMPDPAPEAVEAAPDAKYTGYMSRTKNETRERLLRLRKEKGLTVNDILAADTYGLRWSDVMDMIEAKPVPLPRWEALAKILDKYEEADSGG